MGPNGVNRQEKVYKNDKNKRKEPNRSKIVTNSRTKANSSPVPRTKKQGTRWGALFFCCKRQDEKRAPKAPSASDGGFGRKQSGGLFSQREESPVPCPPLHPPTLRAMMPPREDHAKQRRSFHEKTGRSRRGAGPAGRCVRSVPEADEGRGREDGPGTAEAGGNGRSQRRGLCGLTHIEKSRPMGGFFLCPGIMGLRIAASG